MTAYDTALSALKKAVYNRPLHENMIFHADRGVQYASKATVNYLESYGLILPMSRKGNCRDNAVAESCFKSIKTELLDGSKIRTKQQLRTAVFEYPEIRYNKKRRHYISQLQNWGINIQWIIIM